MQLTHNTIFITGGSSGIGLALARALLALEGNTVIVCGRDQGRLDAAREAHPGLHTLRCDVTDPAQVDATLAVLRARFPALNVLVNNAGVINTYLLAAAPDAFAHLRREVETNLLAAARLTCALLPDLCARPRAALINVTTGTAWVPMPAAPGYSATKAAMHSLTLSLRHQLRETPVQVFEVIPPLVDTPMARRVDVVSSRHRAMSPDALAATVLRRLRRDQLEMRIGMNLALYWLHRLWPRMALRALTRG